MALPKYTTRFPRGVIYSLLVKKKKTKSILVSLGLYANHLQRELQRSSLLLLFTSSSPTPQEPPNFSQKTSGLKPWSVFKPSTPPLNLVWNGAKSSMALLITKTTSIWRFISVVITRLRDYRTSFQPSLKRWATHRLTHKDLQHRPISCLFLLCIAAAVVSDKWGRRWLVIVLFATIGMVGYLLLAAIQDETKSGVRYFGVWLATCGVFPALSINITWLLNNQGGDSKKGAGIAILAIFGQCSSFVSSSAFPDSEG